MGLGISEWIFEKRIPSFKDVEVKFREITGLQLRLIAELNLAELHSSSDKVLDLLTSKNIENNLYNKRPNRLENVELYCFGFESIEFNRKSDSRITLISYSGQYYFIECLNRTLFELGGTFPESFTKEMIDRSIRKWNSLKPWKQYKWYNRPRK